MSASELYNVNTNISVRESSSIRGYEGNCHATYRSKRGVSSIRDDNSPVLGTAWATAPSSPTRLQPESPLRRFASSDSCRVASTYAQSDSRHPARCQCLGKGLTQVAAHRLGHVTFKGAGGGPQHPREAEAQNLVSIAMVAGGGSRQFIIRCGGNRRSPSRTGGLS